MFGNQFYPTPNELIRKMIAPFVVSHKSRGDGYEIQYLKAKSILDPSAGKGNIIDYLTDYPWRMQRDRFSCIEIDPELRMILSEKGYRIIDSDFLFYNDNDYFDLILMNPPFAQGAKHLLKAWEVLAEGDIACVLNAETIRNAYTDERQLLLEIINKHGHYEFHSEQFQDAEHQTDVEVAIVWLHKEPSADSVQFEYDQFEKEAAPKEAKHEENALTSRDQISALVQMYQAARLAKEEQHKARARYNFFMRNVEGRYRSKASEPTLRNALAELKEDFWHHVFEKTKIGKVTTSKFQKKFDGFCKSTHGLAFTIENIVSVLNLFMVNRTSILEECLMNTFDAATDYHKDNKVHWEGWKTNKAYRCSRKIIMPYGPYWNPKYGGSWDGQWNYQDFFSDMDKVMCFLTGQSIESIRTINGAVHIHLDRMRGNKGDDYRRKIYSTFFEINMFKKGTMHVFFRDPMLWDEFNRRAAAGKRWIGENE